MDSLYLRRFNKETPLEALKDEYHDVSWSIEATKRALLDLDPCASYSQVQMQLSKQASLKAKKSYLDRMIGLREIAENRANKELIEAIDANRTKAQQSFFPDDYYGNYPG